MGNVESASYSDYVEQLDGFIYCYGRIKDETQIGGYPTLSFDFKTISFTSDLQNYLPLPVIGVYGYADWRPHNVLNWSFLWDDSDERYWTHVAHVHSVFSKRTEWQARAVGCHWWDDNQGNSHQIWGPELEEYAYFKMAPESSGK